MLEIVICSITVSGALGAWKAKQLRACCLPGREVALRQRPEASCCEGTAKDERPSPTDEHPAAASTSAPLGSDQVQSCADDAAGPPDAKDLLQGHSIQRPEEFHIGTFKAHTPEDDDVTTPPNTGRRVPEQSPGRTPEHYCIGSFISDGLPGVDPVPSAGSTIAALVAPRAFSIRICGRSGKYYELEVSGSGGGPLQAYKLHRRYREFACLDELVRGRLEGLPHLPRKSFFTKRMSSGFMLQRERGLQAFMNSVIEADPNIQDEAVKAFLNPQLQFFPHERSASESLICASSETVSEVTSSFRSTYMREPAVTA